MLVSNCQNLKAKRTQGALELAAGARAVFALTGTPIKNGRPANLYPLLLATRHTLSVNKSKYERRYCAAHATRFTTWDVTGAANLEELHSLTKAIILRRMKTEVLDLPPKVRVMRDLDLSTEARAEYNATLAKLKEQYRGNKARRVQELESKVALGEMDRSDADRKIEGMSNADALVLLGQVKHASSRAKIESTVELAKDVLEEGGQIVLFSYFLDVVDALVAALGPTAGRISGAESSEQRQELIGRFQRGELKAMVCTSAGGVGITLTAARTVVLVDRAWTPGDCTQQEDRCYRIGQTGSVLAVWPRAVAADVQLDTLLDEKFGRSELVLTGKRERLPKAEMSWAEVAAMVLG